MKMKWVLITGALVAATVALVVLFVVAWSGGHRIDKSRYGVTKDAEGSLAVAVSPCSSAGIGEVEVGVGPLGESPRIVFSASLADRSKSVDQMVVGKAPEGYAAEGDGRGLGPDAVVWRLVGADGSTLMANPLRFDAGSVPSDGVLTGEGLVVPQQKWASC